MAVAVQLEFPGATLEQYDQVIKKMGFTPGGPGGPGGISTGSPKPTMESVLRTCGRPKSNLSASPGSKSVHTAPRLVLPLRRGSRF
jgi:hypothetical protein